MLVFQMKPQKNGKVKLEELLKLVKEDLPKVKHMMGTVYVTEDQLEHLRRSNDPQGSYPKEICVIKDNNEKIIASYIWTDTLHSYLYVTTENVA